MRDRTSFLSVPFPASIQLFIGFGVIGTATLWEVVFVVKIDIPIKAYAS